MSSIDLGLIINIVSGTAGIGGLFLAGLANKRAKEANRLTEKANDVAAKSLAEAQKATCVAQEGNRIAGDANTVAERALAATTDHIQYRWKIEIEGEPPAVTVVNDSAHPAMHVTISVDDGHEVIATGSADTVPGLSNAPPRSRGARSRNTSNAAASTKPRAIVATSSPSDASTVSTCGSPSLLRRLRVPHSDVFEQRFSISQGKIKVSRKKT